MERTQNILRGQQTCFLCQMVIMVVEGRVAVAGVSVLGVSSITELFNHCNWAHSLEMWGCNKDNTNTVIMS